MQKLNDMTVAVLGGDAREKTLAKALAQAGATVKTFGLPVTGTNICPCLTMEQCIAGVQALILPIPAIDDRLLLHAGFLKEPLQLTEDLLALLAPHTPVLLGIAKPAVRLLLEKYQLQVVELMAMDEVAILNSIPSAEGAIQMAMERMPITIHGSRAFVLGFGRTGQTLAELLAAMHANTTVLARHPAQLARAQAMGLRAVGLYELIDYLHDVDVIFNTIPALILDQHILNHLTSQTLIIDLASVPGGTDFQYAKERGINAVLAPGLPGKVAPKTAGHILAQVVPQILLEKARNQP